MSQTKTITKSQGSEPAGTETESIPRKRILLVEGDGFTRLVLLLRLRLAGFAVDYTSNGFIGLGKLRSCRPDVLLLELKLYGMSGLELIKAARSEPTFAKRPIYVFTHANRMSRSTSKEVGRFATKVLDKNSMSREALVQALVNTLLAEPVNKKRRSSEGDTSVQAGGTVLPGDIAEVISAVREQSETLAKCKEPGARAASASELLSRVCSLGDFAEAARLRNLARQAIALGKFLKQLGRTHEAYTEATLATVARAVEVMSGISSGATGKDQAPTQYNAVMVDESPGSNRALEKALLDASIKPICFEDPVRAREHLSRTRTELIIINVLLPEAHGLSLPEIRHLPLHAETPIIFARVPRSDDFPNSAPPLDSDPVLMSEVIVRALNEVQSPKPATPPALPPPAAAPKAPVQNVVPPRAVPTRSLEDGFELFATPAGRQSVSPLHLPAQSAPPLPDQTIVQPLSWSVENLAEGNSSLPEGLPQPPAPSGSSEPVADDLSHGGGSIPGEILLPSEPGNAGGEQTAELPPEVAETPVDGIQTDERPVEVMPTSHLQTETPQAPQAALREDQTTPAVDPTVAAGDLAEATPAAITETEFPACSSTPVPELSNHEEVMNDQLETAPAEYAQQPVDSQLAEELSEQQKAEARCAQLEHEVAALRQAFADFDGGFGQHQQAVADSEKRIQELEHRLTETTAELEKQREEQRNAQADLRRQVEAANVASQQTETARQQSEAARQQSEAARQQSEAERQQAEARCAQLEQELGGLRQAQKEQAEKALREQKARAAGDLSGVPASELEQQVRQGVAALARATAELAKERGERQRSEQRATELNSRLQALHEDLRRTHQAQGEDLARIGALEEEQRQTSQALEQRASDLEQERAERALVDEELEKTKAVNDQLRKDLAFFEEANKKFGGSRQELQKRLEESLNGVREAEDRLQKETAERQRVAQSLESAHRELADQSRKREMLEQELQGARDALQEREAKLQQESAERQRLAEMLESVQRRSHDGSERDLEFSKLQSELEHEQVERKRQESLLARMRHSARDAAHAARSLRSSLRRQIREPVDNLVLSTRSLLELELGDQQKKLAEAVLQDVLLMQTRLREPELAHSDAAEADVQSTAA